MLVSSSENSQSLSQSSSVFSDDEEDKPLDILLYDYSSNPAFKTALSSDTRQGKPNSSDAHATKDKHPRGEGINWGLMNDRDNPAPLTNQDNILLSDDDDNTSDASFMNLTPDDDKVLPQGKNSSVSVSSELQHDSDTPPADIILDLNSNLFDEDTSSEPDITLSYDFSSSVVPRGLGEAADISLNSTQQLPSGTSGDAGSDYNLDLLDTDPATSAPAHQDLQVRPSGTERDLSTAMLIDNEDGDLAFQRHITMNEWDIFPADTTPCDAFRALSDHDDEPACSEDDNDQL
jgi:hypothetical protein